MKIERKMWYILTVLILLVHSVLTIDLLPCTDEVNPAEMALARRLLEQSTPPGYRLIEVEPISQTGTYQTKI